VGHGENTVVLLDEEGGEHEFYILDVITVAGSEYAILLGTEEDAEEAEVLRIEEDDAGDGILVEIDDDEEWERVARHWEKLLETDEE